MRTSELRVYSKLQRAAHQAKRAADKALLDAASITTAQASVLMVVAEGRASSQKEAADEIGLKEPAIAAMVARLINLGYLNRRRSQQDARAWTLELTEAGASAMEAVSKPFAEVNAIIEATVGADEMDDFVDHLTALERRFARD